MWAASRSCRQGNRFSFKTSGKECSPATQLDFSLVRCILGICPPELSDKLVLSTESLVILTTAIINTRVKAKFSFFQSQPSPKSASPPRGCLVPGYHQAPQGTDLLGRQFTAGAAQLAVACSSSEARQAGSGAFSQYSHPCVFLHGYRRLIVRAHPELVNTFVPWKAMCPFVYDY